MMAMVSAGDNPFRVGRVEALEYRAPDFDWDSFLAALEARHYRGAIVGPHGSGKTTLLLEAQQRLESMGVPVRYGFLNEQTPKKRHAARAFLQDTPDDTILFLDGAEQLGPVAWWWLRRQSRRLRGFVVTTHQPGHLTTLYSPGADEALLRDLLEQLVPDEVETLWPRARQYFEQKNGNIRDVFFALYDDFATGSK